MARVEHLTFKDLFNCTVCKSHTNKPLYFPCGDILCEGCFGKYASHNNNKGENEKVTCPACIKPSVVQKNQVASLDMRMFKNISIGADRELNDYKPLRKIEQAATNVYNVYTRRKNSEDLYCTICKLDQSLQKTAALYQCMDCLDLLCESCSAVHKKTRYTNKHTVIKLSDADSLIMDDETKKRYILPCDAHPDKALEVYCLSCRQMLCLQCKLVEHNNHLCSDVSPAAANHRNRLKENRKHLKEKIDRAQALLQHCTTKRRLVLKEKATLVGQIIDRAANFKEQLGVYGKNLLDQCDDHYTNFLEHIIQDEKSLQLHLSKLTCLRLLTDRLLLRGTNIELLASEHQYDDKLNEFCTKWEEPTLREVEELHLDFPSTKNLAIGTLFGYLSKDVRKEMRLENLKAFKDRYEDDHGKLPYLSPSGRIYEAESHLTSGLLKKQVTKTDFKECLEYHSVVRKASVKINITTLVLGKPAHIFSRNCTPSNGSVLKLAAMSNNDVVAAVFLRNYDFNQTRRCTRVRLQVYSMSGQIKMDMAYGAVCHGLAVTKDDKIIVSGGNFNRRNVDIIWREGRSSISFTPKGDPGGVAVDDNGDIMVATHTDIEFYTSDGKFIRSFQDDFMSKPRNVPVKGYQHVRKEIDFGVEKEIFIADANTNSVRGYSCNGELLFHYGSFGNNAPPVVNPRSIKVDSLGHVLVADILTHSIHVISRVGSLICKILEGSVREPRAVVLYNGCYIAVGQNDGFIKVFQYLFDKDEQCHLESGKRKQRSK